MRVGCMHAYVSDASSYLSRCTRTKSWQDGLYPRHTTIRRACHDMLPTTRKALIFSRLFAWCFQSVAPVSLIYWTLNITRVVVPRDWHLPAVIEAWLLAEVLFWILVYLPIARAIHGPSIKGAETTRAQRKEIFAKCLATIDDPTRFVSLWANGASPETLGRENVKEWICWAFLDQSSWTTSDQDEELDEYVTALESLLPGAMVFRKGRMTDVSLLRLSVDPVKISHKPLLFYAVGVGLADIYTAGIMWFYGYRHFPTKTWFSSFPCRPQTVLSPYRSAAKHTSYWYRPHTSRTALPILYLHGIGILHTYGDFFADFAQALDRTASDTDGDGQIGIIVVEVLPISFRITHPALSPSEMCSEIQAIRQQHGWTEFVLMANSFGTAISSQLLQAPLVRSQIRDVIFIDPIPFLLHLPDMTYNFTRRLPRSASEHQLHYFASTDLGAAHTLGRRFSWQDHILWKDQLYEGDRRWTIMLSEKDIIVAADAIGRYLTRPAGRTALQDKEEPPPSWKSAKWSGNALDVMWLDGLNHAEVFDTARDRKMVIDIALNYARGESRPVPTRPEGYGAWVERHGLWFKCSPARLMVALGLDKTLGQT